MAYLRCSGSITTSGTGEPQCSVPWDVITDSSVESIFQAMTLAEGSELASSILLIWAVAYGVRFLCNFIVSFLPGRFG